jgi:hypothetical protein
MKALHPRQAVFTRSALLAVFMDLICLKHVWSYSPGHSLMIFPALKLHSVRGFPSQRLSMAKDPKNWNTSKLENYLRCDVKTKKNIPRSHWRTPRKHGLVGDEITSLGPYNGRCFIWTGNMITSKLSKIT